MGKANIIKSSDIHKEVAKSLASLMSAAERQAKTATAMDEAHARRVSAFMDHCEASGLGPSHFTQMFTETMDACKAKGDTNSMTKMVQVWAKLMFERQVPTNSLQTLSMAINNTQNVQVGPKNDEDDEVAKLRAELDGLKDADAKVIDAQ